MLKPYRGGRCPVFIHYQGQTAASLLQLGEGWLVRPEDALLQQLNGALGTDRVALMYSNGPVENTGA
jgi:DNA polymerase-3 subunit alpha